MSPPRILIATDVGVNDRGRERAFMYFSYIEAVREAGGVPFLAPPHPGGVSELISIADGVVIPGGDDFDEELLGEPLHPSAVPLDPRRRDSDLALVREVLARDIPFLGICLGMQLLGYLSGGTIVQDIPSAMPDAIEHRGDSARRPRHKVTVLEGTRLAELTGPGEAEVNTTHHQAVGSVGVDLRVSALAPDGVIEAIEAPAKRFCLGVQWHPEDMRGERMSAPLFKALVEAAAAAGR